MSTGIEYLDEVWNLTAGCSPAGPGCTHCYAAKMTHRLAANPVTRGQYAGLTEDVQMPRDASDGGSYFESRLTSVWTGKVRIFPERLDQPLHWRKPRVVGVDFLADLFHANVLADFIASAFRTMAECPRHKFVVLTKRPARMAAMLGAGYKWPPKNIYLGASVATQADLDAASPHLTTLAAAGWRTWLSCEPLLEGLDLEHAYSFPSCCDSGVIVGAETGHGARPCKAEWIESIVRHCERAGVACYVKSNAPPRTSAWPDASGPMRLHHWVPRPWPRQTPWEAAR